MKFEKMIKDRDLLLKYAEEFRVSYCKLNNLDEDHEVPLDDFKEWYIENYGE